MLRIGPHQLDDNIGLAPMAGVTDLPFRKLCRRLGAGFAAGEMITSDISKWRTQKTRRRLAHDEEAAPRWVQIAGADPWMMAEAAALNVAQGAEIIDINMGCPAKKVCKRAAGSALLEDPGLVRDILQATVDAVPVPVTLKIRTGPCRQRRNGVEIAKIAEEAGIAALAIHGRTRADRFKGEAEYDTIRDIVEAVGIPVLANGDVRSPEQAERVLADTGAAGLLIGRAAQGRPWIFREIRHYLDTGERMAPPDDDEVRDIMLGHLDGLHRFYGEHTGVRIARKHIGWYVADRPDGEVYRRRAVRVGSADEQRRLTELYLRGNATGEGLAA